ncbi:hypothetical protein RclHR1_11030007 [Rhizophagus clarus]|uniref:Uncharacterized protein n=1 Tax=Rhizophagus clarus TaxID=94130 RepID=A0A2Z6Q7V6_9GLOM|nr:hypothetical protein RclHR1_11030007 [Rhizophagus clarus]
MKLDSRNYCQTNTTNWTLELRVPDEYYELDLRIEVSFQTNNTNWALEFRMPDEYYKPDFKIEVSGEGEVNFVINRNGFNASSFSFVGFQMNNTNWTLEFRMSDEYYEPNFKIEVSGEGFLDTYYEPDFGIEASCWQDESGSTQDSVRGGPRGLSKSGLGILGMLLDF